MKVNIKDLQVWPLLKYLPYSLLKTIRLVFVVGTQVLLVTNDDELLVYGFSSRHGLCQKHCTTDTKRRYYDVDNLVKIEEFSKKPIKGVAGNTFDQTLDTDGKLFVVVYLESGEVYHWGYDPAELHSKCFLKPTVIEGMPLKVVKVACGESHCLALTEHGQVFGWGDNSCGQIGPDVGCFVDTARRVGKEVFRFHITDIACGSFFSVAFSGTLNGVYSWGQNDCGQLGLYSDYLDTAIPQFITILQDVDIQRIACGSNHVLALTVFGEPYSWGSNCVGQLGIGTDVAPKNYPQKLSTYKRFKKIAASGDLSVGVTVSGKIYVWGKTYGKSTPRPVLCPCKTIDEVFALFRGRMVKPVKIVTPVDSITETLAKSFGNPENSDFKIIAEEKEIHVHKTVLKLRSEYFRRMFQEQWSEGKTSSVELNENFEALSAYLKYLYTDTLEISHPEVALEVSVIADKYCEPDLVALCVQKFESSLTTRNVASLYELSLERQLEQFSESCLNFASHHVGDIVDTEGFKNWSSNSFKSFFSDQRIQWILKK